MVGPLKSIRKESCYSESILSEVKSFDKTVSGIFFQNFSGFKMVSVWTKLFEILRSLKAKTTPL